MKQHFTPDAWNITEEGFHPEDNEAVESCFSLGNGILGQRAFFEEQYSGASLRGCYMAGIYFTEKTKPVPSKVNYPDCQVKVANSPNWAGIDIFLEGEALDLATCKVKGFRRTLYMKEGLLERTFTAKLVSGKEVKISATRFCSLANKALGVIRYAVKPLNFEGTITINPYLEVEDFNDSPGGGWKATGQLVKKHSGYLLTATPDAEFHLCAGMKFSVEKNKQPVQLTTVLQSEEKFVGCAAQVKCKPSDEIVVFKYAAVVSSLQHEKAGLLETCQQMVRKAYKKGFDKLLEKHIAAWATQWESADIIIEGDTFNQQAIRYNIFQLCQSISGRDEGVNLFPAGFSGHRSGWTMTWENEVFGLPFFLFSAESSTARNLLLQRYKHLQKAIENAEKLGFTGGAALFPAKTVDGTECCSDWEFSFEEIHRNGVIAFSIHEYIEYTGDKNFLVDGGLEMLIGIARFWAQRVHWSQPKQQYVIHGVTGPNAYENNINNNWYTNYMAAWCLKYTAEALTQVHQIAPEKLDALLQRLHFDRIREVEYWLQIADKIHLPVDENFGIFSQQEGFMDKELRSVKTLRPEDCPLHRRWTWDRILRSCFLQRADVLQGFYFFKIHFSEHELCRNFDFYEPMTVHENSLSPSIHAVLAARIGKFEKVYEMYLRTVRFNLDDLEGDTKNGLDVLTMAAACVAFVKGFGGMEIEADMLSFSPFLPANWEGYSFKIGWRNHRIHISISKENVTIFNEAELPLLVKVYGQIEVVGAGNSVKLLALESLSY